jgi:hypothetical protein
MTVPQLKAQLKALNLDITGSKAALIARLEAARDWAAGGGAKAEAAAEAGPSGSGGDERWHKLSAMEFSGSEDEDEGAAAAEEAATLAPVTPAPAPLTPAARKRARAAAAAAAAPFEQQPKDGAGGEEVVAGGGSGSEDELDVAERQLSERLAAASEWARDRGLGGEDAPAGWHAAGPAHMHGHLSVTFRQQV